MNYKQCLIFREVARTENFTKAAQKLFLTQSAVSHAIKELEAEAGVPLFERLHRSVRITRAGNEFLKEVQPLIEAFNKTQRHLEKLQSTAPLALAVSMTYAEAQLPQLMQTFRQEHPEVPVAVTILPAEDCLKLLAAAQVDLAIVEGPLPQHPWQQKTFDDYLLVPVAAADSAGDTWQVADFLAQPLLLREKGSAIRETLAAFMTLHQLQLTPAWESLDTASLISAVAADLGVSLLPLPLVAKALQEKRIRRLPLKELELPCPVTALVRNSANLQGPLAALWQMLG